MINLSDSAGNFGPPLNRIFWLFIFFFFNLFSPAQATQLMIEPEMGRSPLLNSINQAKQTLELVMYGFTDQELLNALLKQNENKKNLQVILEQHPYQANDENNRTISALERAHIQWQGHIPPYHLIHEKALIIDNKQALVMTFNFTKSSFKRERNLGLIIDDLQQVAAIDSIFKADWNHKKVDLANPIFRDIILSPENSRAKLTTLIHDTKYSLRIYAQSISDYQIIGEMAHLAKKGVSVEILTSNTLRKKQAAYLRRAGVKIHQLNQYYVHAKALIIDNKCVVIGSINLTKASLDQNRELSVITRDQDIVAKLNQLFLHDWGRQRSHSARYSPSHHTLSQRQIKRWLRLLTLGADNRVRE